MMDEGRLFNMEPVDIDTVPGAGGIFKRGDVLEELPIDFEDIQEFGGTRILILCTGEDRLLADGAHDMPRVIQPDKANDFMVEIVDRCFFQKLEHPSPPPQEPNRAAARKAMQQQDVSNPPPSRNCYSCDKIGLANAEEDNRHTGMRVRQLYLYKYF
jgi:hypothetical protein